MINQPAPEPGTSTAPPPSGQSPILAPISLPKGGGAIRNIGDSFTANPASGTGSMTIPVPTTSGRSGLQPQLTLSYDSGHGNGPFGIGWNLGLPTITRRTDRGMPRYLDDAESDIFLWSGAEDLVPIPFGVGLVDDRTDPTFLIHRYRPRVDHSYARIERWVSRTDATDVHWRTMSSDNLLTVYGLTASDRVADSANPGRIFTWLISQTRDTVGNAVIYDYKTENADGVDVTSLSEHTRGAAADPRRQVNRYLKQVRYGNTVPLLDAAGTRPRHLTPTQMAATDWHFTVVLDYGEHNANHPTPTEDGPWTARPDPFSTYRSGFEVRSYRLCRRLMMFHHFPDETDPAADAMVGSLSLSYQEAPTGSMLASAAQNGHRLTAAGDYVTGSMPPLEFTYTQGVISETLGVLDAESLENLPVGVDGTTYRFTDIDAEGVPGILTEQAGLWRYKPSRGNGRYEPGQTLPTLPVPAIGAAATSLMDLAGGGRLDLVALSGPTPGFYRRTLDNGWEPETTFKGLPEIDWRDPNMRFVDLDGDGLADILLTRDDAFTWYPSLGQDGFGAAATTTVARDETAGPRLVFADGTDTVYLADMSGDGLSDLVRIRNSDISYWPNIGYGKFGLKRPMGNAPQLDRPDAFDGKRIRLADIDGNGTTDLIYLGVDAVCVYRNESGNSWAAGQVLSSFPQIDDTNVVATADVLGNGTSCLVWSSPLPADTRRPLRYLDLMGGTKPHLLVGVVNNMGSETRVSYLPSTAFYLQDKAAGTPWITRLPFPVQVVERTETLDLVGRTRYVTRYSYHHGYYDGVEREFRGFARVEKWDTEEHRTDLDFTDPESFTNEAAAAWQPPTQTRTWFHTGAPTDLAVTRHLASEYWVPPSLQGDAQQTAREAWELPDSTLPTGLTADEWREAMRALRGTALRTEITSLDGTDRADIPYETTEQRVQVRLIQPMGSNRHAVFAVDPGESVHFQYERNPDDPRISHDLTLQVDDFGNTLKKVTLGYGRLTDPTPEPALSVAQQEALRYDQHRMHNQADLTDYTNPLVDPAATPDTHHTPKVSTAILAELTAPLFTQPAGTGLRRIADVQAAWTSCWDPANLIPFEQLRNADIDGAGPQPDTIAARITSQTVTAYRADDLTDLLAQGELQPLALPGQTYRLALTDGLLTTALNNLVTPAILAEGGYVQLSGKDGWWAPSGRAYFSAGAGDTPAVELAEARNHFFLPQRSVDPFGAVTQVSFDAYDLLPVRSVDPVGNTTVAENDYRVMHPVLTTDPNGNTAAVAIDCFGAVVGTCLAGKNGEGDTLAGFIVDLDDATLAAATADPIGQGPLLLGSATSRIIIDRNAHNRTGSPVAAYTMTRETHMSDLAIGQQTAVQHLLVYYDGLGREAQHKAQAEPGPIPPDLSTVSPRWIGSGWTIYNNKGKPDRTYEPFFTATSAFEFAPSGRISVVLLYDPIGRVAATVHPDDRTYEKTVVGAWVQADWDANDTVATSDPRTDPDVGAAFTQLLGTGVNAWTSWYDVRNTGTYGSDADEQAANQDAAVKAAAHANTPTVRHFDSLGRTCLTVLDNGTDAGGHPMRFATRTALSTGGKPLAVIDAIGRRTMEYTVRDTAGADLKYLSGYDIAGQSIYNSNSDAGERRAIFNIAGHPIRTWDARGHTFRLRYDPLQRPTHHYVQTAAAAEKLIQRRLYGEHHPDPACNLKGRLFRDYNSAGVVSTKVVDFKGNTTASYRQIAAQRVSTTLLDWTAIDTIVEIPMIDIPALDQAAAASLAPTDLFATSSTFDAMNRTTQTVLPHQDGMPVSIVQPTYNEANLLNTFCVWLRQPVGPTTLLHPATADIPAITGIDYNEHGQRLTVSRGNGTTSIQVFDPATRRLNKLTTTRPNPDPNATTVQDLHYTYDAHGNITRLGDTADIHKVIFFKNQRVEPSADYTYDPIYRLIRATGREHLGQTGAITKPPVQPTNSDSPRTQEANGGALLSPSDGNAMGNYIETYQYDAVGNIVTMSHQIPAIRNGWSRQYVYNEASRIVATETGNRITATSIPGDLAGGPYTAQYQHDEHGNIRLMPHLPTMQWDELDRLAASSTQVVNAGSPETTFYLYDGQGERIRKATYGQATAGTQPIVHVERLYLGTIEIYRRHAPNGNIVFERETLHGLLDHRTVVLAETRTIDLAGTDPSPERLVRYQYANHLSSATLELDDTSAVISYEEYFPYGSTAYQAVRSSTETPKRYRYTGQERDEENDLYYHGARYYVPWLGCWTACDPAGMDEGPNLYLYAHDNPVSINDPTGMWGWRETGIVAGVVAMVAVTAFTGGVAAPVMLALAESALGAGAVASVAAAAGAGIVSGAVGGAAGELTRQVVGHETVNGSKILGRAVQGGIFNGAVGAAAGGIGVATEAVAATAWGKAASETISGTTVGRAGAAIARVASAGAKAVARLPGVRQLGNLERAGQQLGGRVLAGSLARVPGQAGAAVSELRELSHAELKGVFGGSSSSAGGVQSGGAPSLRKLALAAGAEEELGSKTFEVLTHGTTDRVASELVASQGSSLSASGGNHGGQFFAVPDLEVANVFAERAAGGTVGAKAGVVGISLEKGAADRLRSLGLLRRSPIPNPPPGVSAGSQQWVFQPGALKTLQQQAFFFKIR